MDKGGSFEKRGRTLEDEFFYRVDAELAEQLRAKLAAEEHKVALSQVSGLTDDHALDALVEAKITKESFAALTLVPLTRIAWADRHLDASEREAILKAAAESHCPAGSVGHELLQSWLNEPPPDSLYDAWQAYTHLLCARLPEDARGKLRDHVVGQARDVAVASGGFLGIHKISAKEEAVLEELERVFCSS